MKTKLFANAAVCAIAMPVLAAPVSSDGWVEVGGEVGWIYVGLPSVKTRQQVIQELENWRRNPVAADGWRETGSEVGWTYVGVPSVKTRQQVIQELEVWRKNPVSIDGWREVGGDVGWVYEGRPTGRR